MNAPDPVQHTSPIVERHDPALWQEGLRTGVPSLFGIAAWGLVVGIAMVKTGLSPLQACGMTLLVFAGSAQLASLRDVISGFSDDDETPAAEQAAPATPAARSTKES